MTAVKKAKKKAQRSPKEAKAAFGRAIQRAINAGMVTATPLNAAHEMVVSVEVDANHLIPYGVFWDSQRILDKVVSASAKITLTPGKHALGWMFDHGLETSWRHKLSVSIDGGTAAVLEQKSSQNGDKPASADRKVFDV